MEYSIQGGTGLPLHTPKMFSIGPGPEVLHKSCRIHPSTIPFVVLFVIDDRRTNNQPPLTRDRVGGSTIQPRSAPFSLAFQPSCCRGLAEEAMALGKVEALTATIGGNMDLLQQA